MEREEGKTGRRRLEVVTDDDERWALGGACLSLRGFPGIPRLVWCTLQSPGLAIHVGLFRAAL